MSKKNILIVLGEKVIQKNQMSPVTILRLKAALSQWKTGKYNLIVVTGGIFQPPYIQTIPIAVLMSYWLTAEKVPYEQIVIEDQSRDTFENIRLSMEMLVQRGFNPDNTALHIVSHWQHVYRAQRTSKSYGWISKKIALKYPIGIRGFIFECMFILVHLADPRGRGRLARWNRSRRTY